MYMLKKITGRSQIKKKDRKKSICCWLVGSMAMFLLAGCGSPQGAEKQETTVEAEVPQTQTLRFLGWKSGKEEGAIPRIIQAFEEENPGVTVKYEAIPTSNNYQEILNARLFTGECADVFMASENMLRGIVNYTEDLSEIPFTVKFQENLKKMLTKDGRMMAIPIEEAGLGMVVNQDVLKEAGVTSLPECWTELLTVCEKVKESGKVPFIMANRTGWSGAVMVNYGATTRYRDYDNDIYYRVQSGEVKIADMYREYLEKYELLEELGYTNGKESLILEFNEGAVTEFEKGDAAFLIAGTWMVEDIVKAMPGTKLVFTPIPIQDRGPALVQCNLSTALAVNRDSENKELAIAFLQFWSREENLKEYVESQSAFSPIQEEDIEEAEEFVPVREAMARDLVTVGMKIPSDFAMDDWSYLVRAVQLIALREEKADALCEKMNREAATLFHK